jgi:hypothetical protein
MVWREIGIGSNGQRYDVNQDLIATLSKPTIYRDIDGRISQAKGSRRHVDQIQRALERDGRSARIVAEPIEIDLRRMKMTFPMDDDIKRVSIKMSIAAPRLLHTSVMLDSSVRRYLLDGIPLSVCPVRIAIDEYVELDRRRPSVGHLVYVRAVSSEHRTYSIVQFFSVFQFYCELASNYDGPDWAVLATHNPIDHLEKIEFVEPVDYPLPERYISGTVADAFQGRMERLRLELVALYGDQAPASISTAG